MILKLILFGLALSITFFWIGWEIGKRNLEKDYHKDYTKLKDMVNGWKATKRNANVIKKQFEAIVKYGCRNHEKLQVLEGQFHRRFNAVISKRKCKST